MTCPNSEKWTQLSLGLLSEIESASLCEHVQGCNGCRVLLGRARRDHATLLRAFEVFDRDHDVLREQLMTAARHVEPARPNRAPPLIRLGRRIGDSVVNLSTTNRRWAAVLAPAACLLIAVGVFFWPGTARVALAQVIERMKQARSMVCDVTTIVSTGTPAEKTIHAKLAMSASGGELAWLYTYADPPATELKLPDRIVYTQGEQREIITLGNELTPADMLRRDEWFHRLLTATTDADRALGSETIDGRKVVGFEIAGWKLGLGSRPTADTPASSQVQLWVDAETQLPVRFQIKAEGPSAESSTQIAWDHIQWDVPVDAQAFVAPPETPADKVTNLAVPAVTEESLISGLRAYLAQSEQIAGLLAQIETQAASDPERLQFLKELRTKLFADSAYPLRLDSDWLIFAAVGRQAGLAGFSLGQALAGGDAAAAERVGEETQRTSKEIVEAMAAVSLFYQKLLVEQRAPEYFGATVSANDADAVLLRWKLDNQQTRVVYGDLRIETVAAK